MRLDLKVFLFDAKKDYLPYYKNYTINVEPTEPISTILPKIKEQCREFAYPKERVYFRVNSLVVSKDITIEEITKKFGNELTIEPISTYRAVNSLIIDDSDFWKSFELLEEFCDNEDREFYNKLYGVHYASESFNYNKKYIGDAVIILAGHLIEKNRDIAKDILARITIDGGLWDAEYDNNMFEELEYTELFNRLKKEASNPPKNRVCKLFTRGYKDFEIEQEFGVAVYGTNEFKESVKKRGFVVTNFAMQNKKCGISMVESNEKMALLKAGKLLADAYDSGANILVVEDSKLLNFFKDNIGKIERVLNRDIRINLFTIDELSKIELAA
jgi:succinate dehydrogenase/fumarate reductase-like Fe-S protein